MKIVYLALAFLFLAIGAVGVVLPVLPTTPFLLVAGACFARGSERFHRWFLGSRLYQKHLDSFVKSRAMTLRTMLILAMVLVPILPMRIFILCLIAFKYFYFFTRIKTIREEAAPVYDD